MHFALLLLALFLATWRSFFTAAAFLVLSLARLGIGGRPRRGRSLVQPLSLVAVGAESVIHGQRHSFHRLALFTVTLLICARSTGQTATDYKKSFIFPKDVPVPANNKLTPNRVRLGEMLFFDPRLSGSNWISCATCHNPALGWSDGQPTAIGNGMNVLKRSTPSIVNTAFNQLQMWDGSFDSLEEQALGPMQAHAEMNGSMEQILGKLKSIPGYLQAFEKAYPGEGVTEKTLAKAIASFERTVISKNSPFDSWVHGNPSAISPSAQRGFELFVGKAKCAVCHSGPRFTDDGFHNIGLKDNTDEGRYVKKPVRAMKGAFKTPTLRDIALTAPYMHNGAYRTLEGVVDHYNRGGDAKENLDPNIKLLDLTSQEKKDLVQFLKTLSGKQVAVTLPRLPQ
jgi:cytochrome c peroxidase